MSIHRISGSLAILGLAVCLVMAASADEPTTTLPKLPKPGRYTLALRSGNFDRVALIHIPVGYQPGTKAPLVLLLHGGGGSASDAIESDGWAAKADKEGFLLVAPEGLGMRPGVPANFKTNPRVWNTGQFSALSPRAAIDDVAFIRQLLDELKDKLPYDEGRVFSTGHSNGGGMTLRLAAEISDRFAAIGTVAGLMAIEDPKPTKPVPTLYIIGTKDPIMPLDGGEVKTPWGRRMNRPVAEHLVKWAEANGCEKEAKVISDQDDVKKVEYPSKGNGPTLTVLYLEGHGHQYPGGKKTLPESVMGPTTSKLDATDTIWAFFRSFPSTKK